MFVIPDQRSIIENLPEGHFAANLAGRKELLDLSRAAAQMSYSPYSGFPVGAAVKTWSGKTYQGHNTETAGSEGINCGERAAVLNAVSHGEHHLRQDFLQVVALSCVLAPSPYEVPLSSKSGKLIEKAITLAVEDQEEKENQMNFAGLTPGWLSNQFVGAALQDGSPCGACRQVMNDFAGEHTIILLDDRKDGVLFRMKDLLPGGFRFGGTDSQVSKRVVDVEWLETQVQAGNIPLEEASRLAALNSYAWGNFLENGTSIRCKDGNVYTGASMVNSSTGLSINSPRAAINRAILDGAIDRCGVDFIDEIHTGFTKPMNGRDLPRGFVSDLMLEFSSEKCKFNVHTPQAQASLKKSDFLSLFMA